MRHISKPLLVEKSYKLAGIELVDLVSYKLSRIFLKKSEKDGNEIEASILRGKKLIIGGLPEKFQSTKNKGDPHPQFALNG